MIIEDEGVVVYFRTTAYGEVEYFSLYGRVAAYRVENTEMVVDADGVVGSGSDGERTMERIEMERISVGRSLGVVYFAARLGERDQYVVIIMQATSSIPVS